MSKNLQGTPIGFKDNPKDYELVFALVGDEWREVGHSEIAFANMLLCDFLNYINIQVPDYTQFLRVMDDYSGVCFEYRSFGNRVRINVYYKD